MSFNFSDVAFVASLAPAYEPETLAHAARVATAGGTGVNLALLDGFIKAMKTTTGGLSNVSGVWAPGLGYLTSSGQVAQAFSPDPASRDMLPVSSYNGPTVLTASTASTGVIAGVPRFFFNSAVLGVPSFPLGPSQYAFAAVLSAAISFDDNHLIGYGPDDASFIEIRYYSGKIRAHHAIGYGGTEAAQAANYDGSVARVSSRWLASRTTPSDVIAKLNGETMGYVSNAPRPTLTPTQRNKLLTIGGGTFYGSLMRAANLNAYFVCVLNTEDAAVVGALDNFLKTYYGMPA